MEYLLSEFCGPVTTRCAADQVKRSNIERREDGRKGNCREFSSRIQQSLGRESALVRYMLTRDVFLSSNALQEATVKQRNLLSRFGPLRKVGLLDIFESQDFLSIGRDIFLGFTQDSRFLISYSFTDTPVEHGLIPAPFTICTDLTLRIWRFSPFPRATKLMRSIQLWKNHERGRRDVSIAVRQFPGDHNRIIIISNWDDYEEQPDFEFITSKTAIAVFSLPGFFEPTLEFQTIPVNTQRDKSGERCENVTLHGTNTIVISANDLFIYRLGDFAVRPTGSDPYAFEEHFEEAFDFRIYSSNGAVEIVAQRKAFYLDGQPEVAKSERSPLCKINLISFRVDILMETLWNRLKSSFRFIFTNYKSSIYELEAINRDGVVAIIAGCFFMDAITVEPGKRGQLIGLIVALRSSLSLCTGEAEILSTKSKVISGPNRVADLSGKQKLYVMHRLIGSKKECRPEVHSMDNSNFVESDKSKNFLITPDNAVMLTL